MKSTIVFFDIIENSKRGTLRGLVILPIFVILTMIWFFITKKRLYNKHIDKVSNFRLCLSMIVSSILIVSAIGVHTPDTIKKAIVYGGSVGLLLYGMSNSVHISTSNKWSYSISIIDTTWGVFSTALIGGILYYIVKKWPQTFDVI